MYLFAARWTLHVRGRYQMATKKGPKYCAVCAASCGASCNAANTTSERGSRTECGRQSQGQETYLSSSDAVSARTTPPPNIRSLVRKWEPQLERYGDVRFNPLQMDVGINLPDAEGLMAECVEQAAAGQGVKALPMVKGGRYQYEVELLRDSALIVGWSSAMSLPSAFDFQGYGFSSDGTKIHGSKAAAYGAAFGKKGDVIGALIAWPAGESIAALHVSFVLNGQLQGCAFEVEPPCPDDKTALAVALQPHVSQVYPGSLFQVRLRGCGTGLPLVHPINGYAALSAILEADFSPFSEAVVAAAEERTVLSITQEQLRNFHVPDTHVVELYDFLERLESETVELTTALARSLSLQIEASDDVFHVRIAAPCASTALVACRRSTHARRLIALTQDADASDGLAISEAVLLAARPMQHATSSSREALRLWRGEEFRPQADPSAARRLIHGSLQSNIPLHHLFQEKSRRAEARDATSVTREPNPVAAGKFSGS